MRVWLRLDHPNILQLRGFITEKDMICPSLLTDWMENGSLRRYLVERSEIDKLLMVSRNRLYMYQDGSSLEFRPRA